MSMAKAKTINLLLYEGDLDGVISIEDSYWNSGEMYSAPRESVSELLNTDACKKYGVYLLLSKNMVYVGQSSDLSKRINQHISGKNWWESVVILTTKDDSLTHSDIDYLESVLIEKARKINRLDCDNKNKGNNPKIDKFRSVFLSQYLDEALFLMQLIGITVFGNKTGLINTIDVRTKLTLGKKAKKDAVKYLENRGIVLGNNITYAVKQPEKDEYWANPKTYMLNKDWDIILNNNETMELVLLHIPAFTIDLEDGLKCRTDKPDLINLRINSSTFVDLIGGYNFSTFVTRTIKY